MPRLLQMYFTISAVMVVAGLIGHWRPSITFGYPVIGGLFFLTHYTIGPHIYRRLPGSPAVHAVITGVAVIVLYRLWRAVAGVYGW